MAREDRRAEGPGPRAVPARSRWKRKDVSGKLQRPRTIGVAATGDRSRSANNFRLRPGVRARFLHDCFDANTVLSKQPENHRDYATLT